MIGGILRSSSTAKCFYFGSGGRGIEGGGPGQGGSCEGREHAGILIDLAAGESGVSRV